MDEEQLQQAVNDALRQAKESGDFDGKDGNGIESAVLNADYTLTITFTNGAKYTTPSIRGKDGEDAVSPTVVVKESTEDAYVLTITDANGSFDTPNLRGGGGGGAPMWIYAFGQSYNSLGVITKDGYESDFDVDNLFEISRQRPIFLVTNLTNVVAGKSAKGYFAYNSGTKFYGFHYDFDGNRVPATAEMSVNASNGTKQVAITDEKWAGNSVNAITPGVENAGKLLYVDADGNGSFLQLGTGLEIINGRLCITGTVTPDEPAEAITFTQTGENSVTVSGVVFAQQEDGTVLWRGATFTPGKENSVVIK